MEEAAKKKPRAKLWVFFGYEGDRDVMSFANWKEYRAWRKSAPRCTVFKMVRGHERDHELGRKAS